MWACWYFWFYQWYLSFLLIHSFQKGSCQGSYSGSSLQLSQGLMFLLACCSDFCGCSSYPQISRLQELQQPCLCFKQLLEYRIKKGKKEEQKQTHYIFKEVHRVEIWCFCLYPAGQNLMIWQYLAAREAGKWMLHFDLCTVQIQVFSYQERRGE